MLNGLYVLNVSAQERVFHAEARRRIARHVNVVAEPMASDELLARPAMLNDVDVLLTGWGGPRLDADLLAEAPRLRAVFYGAGSVKKVMADAAWERGIVVTSAYAANAVPVAEFTVAQIVMGLKGAWRLSRQVRAARAWSRAEPVGCYGSTVGLMSLGAIGRLVAGRLRDGFDFDVLAYDPFADAATAKELGVTLVGLSELFAQSDVVSCHTPWLPETVGLVRGDHLRSMKPDAIFINTARGAVVNEPELIEALRERPDLTALLDVTYPEPPLPDSPLWALDNVVLTPHIAGSLGNELGRMGTLMADEVDRYAAGEPMHYAITREAAARMA